MIKTIKMPSAGQTTDKATIFEIPIKIGEKVKRGDVLMQVETDKTTMPVESFAEGLVIDIKVKPGDVVDAGFDLVLVGDEKDFSEYQAKGIEKAIGSVVEKKTEDEYQPIMPQVTKAETIEGVSAPTSASQLKAMPNAKQLAKQNSIDLSQVPHQTEIIKKGDVEKFIDSQQQITVKTVPPMDTNEFTIIPQSRMRKTIGKRMMQSVSEIPAFQAVTSVDMTNAMALRQMFLEKEKVKISYNDLIAKAIAITAKKYPLVNACYENEEIRVYNHTNVGLAVALDDGLIVPVVRAVETKGLLQIAEENKGNINKARKGTLLPTDYGFGSCSISNIGNVCIGRIQSDYQSSRELHSGDWNHNNISCMGRNAIRSKTDDEDYR